MKKVKFKRTKIITAAVALVLIIAIGAIVFRDKGADGNGNEVLIKTSMGDIVVELYPEEAPITVENFKSYVEEGFYDGLVFHRVIKDFMVQGGGFEATGAQKTPKAPIKLESNNGLSNEEYTIAMARTIVADSATSQFFINSNNNAFLDYSAGNEGYAVFGKVVKGQNVVDEIEGVQTAVKGGVMADWPVEDVVIESISIN